MTIELECVGCELQPLEEMYIATTIGRAVVSSGCEVEQADIAIWASRANEDEAYRCAMELHTPEGRVFIHGAGSSAMTAIMDAGDRVDRELLKHFFAKQRPSDPQGSIAA